MKGQSKTSTYRSWRGMKQRCDNPKNPDYGYYGGRGIHYDPAWEKFENFYADMGDRPEGTSINRKNNNLNYCKENCEWSTQQEQCRNRDSNRMLTLDGREMCLTAWSEETGICVETIKTRIDRYGWSVERSLTTQEDARKQLFTYDGQTLCLTDWARKTGINHRTLSYRIAKGWSIEKALTTPPVRRRKTG